MERNRLRKLLNYKAPLLIFLGLALLAWAYWAAGGFGSMLSQPSQFAPEGLAEFGETHWQPFLQSPPIAFIECFKV